MGPSGRRARVQILFAQLFVAPRAGAWVETLCVVFLPRFLPPGHFLLLNRFRALFTRLAVTPRPIVLPAGPQIGVPLRLLLQRLPGQAPGKLGRRKAATTAHLAHLTIPRHFPPRGCQVLTAERPPPDICRTEFCRNTPAAARKGATWPAHAGAGIPVIGAFGPARP